MRGYKDNYTFHDENENIEIAISSVIGDREEQQDNSGYELRDNEALITICDGMGGLNGGKIASTTSVQLMCHAFSENYPSDDMGEILFRTIVEADKKVASIKDENGELMKAGSTLVASYINENRLYWYSVGDSRIYIYRDEELVQITKDHNYKAVLDEQLASDGITFEEYKERMENGEALISFLGINGLPQIDMNDTGFELISGDRIIMMSDGLYKLLDNDSIFRIINNFNNVQDALSALEIKAAKAAIKNKICRDNMTVALVRIK